MRNPLESEAYNKYITPVQGVKLSDFMDLRILEDIAEVLGRPMTEKELDEFVGFEPDENGPKIYTCKCCRSNVPAVWWKEPTKEFFKGLEKLKNLDECLKWYPIDEFGCHFMDEDNLLNPPVFICGSIFRSKKGSCLIELQDWREENGLDRIIGRRMRNILKEQDQIRQTMQEVEEAKALKERRKAEKLKQEAISRGQYNSVQEEREKQKRDEKIALATKQAQKRMEEKKKLFASVTV